MFKKTRLLISKPILTFVVSKPSHRGYEYNFWNLFKTILIVNIFALLIILQAEAFSKTIYVPDNCSTIQSAVDAASPDDTIIIRDGTYIENVEIDKNLTIKSENGAEKTLIQAANSEYHVFDVITDYVNINGFTISGADALGKVGIFLDNVEYCIISNNIISENSRGIHLDHSDNNTITKNNVKTSFYDGILLAKNSNNNTITKNNINFNDSKDSMTLTSGICLADSNGNSIYLNNFVKNGNNIYYLDFEFEKTCIWDSTSKITYAYKGNTYTSNLGNYWDDYTGTDADGDGIGDTPYNIRNRNKDRRPLMQPFENYIEGNFGDGNTGTDNKSAIDSTKKSITATETPNSDNFFTLEFLIDSLRNKKRGVTSKEEKISVEKNEVESLSAEMIEIDLYFSDSQAMYLVPERRKILKTSTLAKHIVNELIKGPASPDLYPTIPQGTQVNEVYIAGDIVYIDLSEEVFKNHPGGSSSQLMAVYSIVNTLTEITPIRGVQILVEGNEKKSLVGHLDISRPLLRDEDWIKP